MAHLVLICAWLALFVPPVAAQTTTVEAIVVGSEEFDGAEVTVEGELVGDYGRRSDGTTWAQMNGGSYVTEPLREGGELAGSNVGIGVMFPRDLADGLDPPGGYGMRGPVVSLTGTWHHHDASRGGESYLEVIAVELIEPGRPLDQAIAWWPIAAGLVLVAVAMRVLIGSRPRS